VLWPVSFKIDNKIFHHTTNIPKRKEYRLPPEQSDSSSQEENMPHKRFSVEPELTTEKLKRLFSGFFMDNQELGNKFKNDALFEFLMAAFRQDHIEEEDKPKKLRAPVSLSSEVLAIFTYAPNIKPLSESFYTTIPRRFNITEDIIQLINAYLSQVSYFS
jgi:hypothetical protein